ncbi:MAG: ArsR family transcriptional regulator [Thermodesulfobacteriota bacterium]|nr:ArsR family transcriptional regulator [Thermodesulfobacteriota bacterium]
MQRALLRFNGSIQREVTSDMEDATIIRVSAQEAKEMVEAESGLLVCAYDDEDKFKRNHLSGAISLAEFRSRLTSIPRDREIVFYCA